MVLTCASILLFPMHAKERSKMIIEIDVILLKYIVLLNVININCSSFKRAGCVEVCVLDNVIS